MDHNDEAVVRHLTEAQCWELLARAPFARLATVVRDEIDLYPINVIAHEGALLFRTAPGSKLLELSVNPRVALEVDEFDDLTASSVVVKGIAERVERQSEIDAADALPHASWVPTLKYRWVRVRPRSITGRSFVRGPEPDRYSVVDG